MPTLRFRSSRSSSKQADQTTYLTYYDAKLTNQDVSCLRSDWLTDANIAFWEEFLERTVLSRYPQARIVLLRPSMTFILLRDPDVNSIAEALPSFHHVTHVFLPVNDNRNAGDAGGGSHWSLLLVSVIDRVAFHYDSLGGYNWNEGRILTWKLGRVLGMRIRFHELDDTPQQPNTMDCGVFVCILMRHLLLKRLLNANHSQKVSMSMANKMVDSVGGRREMLQIVEALRKDAERIRSRSPRPSTTNESPRIG